MIKKQKYSFILIVVSVFFLFYLAEEGFASDSGVVAEDVAVSHIQDQWVELSNQIAKDPISHITGQKTRFVVPDTVTLNRFGAMEYQYSGDVTTTIRYVASTDPTTVEVNKIDNKTFEFIRGTGMNKEVKIQVGYNVNYNFQVWEDTIFGWVRVNDKSGNFETVIHATVAVNNTFYVTPKPNNVLEINQSLVMDPSRFVTFGGDSANVLSSWGVFPDVTKLGSTQGIADFTKGNNSQAVTIDFDVRDTLPPTGTIKPVNTLEAGKALDFKALVLSSEDNSKLPVTISAPNATDFLTAQLGNYPYTVRLTDTSGNYSDLATTVALVDTTPPQVTAKKVTLELGMQANPEDFATATDNYKYATFAWSYLQGSPDFKKLGTQSIDISVKDQSGNQAQVAAELLIKDTLAPTAKGVPQVVSVGDSLPANPKDLLTDIQDNDALSNLTFRYVSQGDTSVVGFSQAQVQIADSSGNQTTVLVPVFTKDDNTTIVGNDAIYATDFEIWQDDLSQLSDSEIKELLRSRSLLKGWNIVTGEDRTAAIQLKQTQLRGDSPVGKYTTLFELNANQKSIETAVKNPNDLVRLRIPTALVFGVSDVSKDGMVQSPTYEIKNESHVPVKVSLDSFNNTSASGLTLLAAGDPDPTTSEAALRLNMRFWNTGGLVAEVNSLTPITGSTVIGQIDHSASLSTKFTGKYYGDFTKERTSQHLLTLKFEPVK